jgi:predicted acetyltransferase
MEFEIRATTDDEYPSFARAVDRAFSEHPSPEVLESWRAVHEPERSLAAFEGSEIIGTAGAFGFTLTVPGGEVPMAAVTAVGVAATHRRRGILTSLMRRQLDDVHELDEPVATLWASEGPIYQRFGYGMGAYACSISVDRDRTQYFWPIESPGRMRMIEKDEALKIFPTVYDRVRNVQPGMFAREAKWWAHLYEDLKESRDGASALFNVVHETPDGPDGYVTYRVMHRRWTEGYSTDVLRVRELMAATPEAYAALWRYCFDVDLIGTIEAWPRPIDEPLMYILGDPLRLKLTLTDGIWVRLVDVPAALAARRYAAEGALVLQVRDPFCPWNEGRFLLEGGPDGAECAPTDREADLLVQAADLGARYLGEGSFGVLARAGRTKEQTAGTIVRADHMFSWDPRPWCPQVF